MPYRRPSYRRPLLLLALALGAALPVAAQQAHSRVTLVRPHDVVRTLSDTVVTGVSIGYRAAELPAQMVLAVFDARGRELISWGGRDGTPLPPTALDSVFWNLRYPGVTGVDSAEWVPGPLAPPGRYTVRLTAGDDVDSTSFMVRADPSARSTKLDYGEQLAFLLRVRDRLAEATRALRASRTLRSEMAARRLQVPDSLRTRFDLIANLLTERLTGVEQELRQTGRTGIGDQLATLLVEGTVIDGHPTDVQYSVFMQQQIKLDMAVERLRGNVHNLLPFMNATLAMAGLEPLPTGMSLAAR